MPDIIDFNEEQVQSRVFFRPFSNQLDMKPTLFLIAFLFLIFASGAALANEKEPSDNPYLVDLTERAAGKRLSSHRIWQVLLHYKPNFWGRYESEEDGPDFFISPVGKFNPETELAETIKSFFMDPALLSPGEEHPQCNFPARYHWLKAELSFDPDRLPEQACGRLKGWLENLNPDKITMVFASYYLNNPASMFGHTLLRIDSQNRKSSLNLLNYGVNYAATVDTENALLYAIKGLFGFFKGTFTVFPYYTKVQTYSNLESRDLWEYELAFSESQIHFLLLHLWELGGNYFDYYYLQENCSYHLLSLLEVADPTLHLTDQFLFSVIPSETIKAIARQEGLIRKKVYRPSLLSQMNHKILQMDSAQKKVFFKIAKNPSFIQEEPYLILSAPSKALVLDAYLDFSQYQAMRRENAENTVDAETRAVLLERSGLGIHPSEPSHEQTQFSTLPEQGHGSARLKLGVGKFDHQWFEEIAFRPSYHDLLAKHSGYSKDSQIVFLDTSLRYYHDLEKVKLNRFLLLDIISLSPFEPLFKKKSWQFSLGIDTIRDLDCGFCNSLKGNYGIGLTFQKNSLSPLLIYSLLTIEMEGSNHLDHNYRIGGGGTLGILIDIGPDYKIQLLGNYLSFPFGHESNLYSVTMTQRYALTQNLDVRLEMERFEEQNNWAFSLQFYF